MIKIISVISFVFAGLLGLLFLLNLLRAGNKKISKKVRKEIGGRIRLYAVAGAIFLIAGVALMLIPEKSAEIKGFISEDSPEDIYKRTQKTQDLPARLYAVGDDYYVLTGKGTTYGHLSFKDEEKTIYKNGLCYRNLQAICGDKNLLATLNSKGELRLNGAFEYLTYENDPTYFSSERYAKKCSFLAATGNNLMYVSNGDLYSAGYNAFGRLGDGTERNRTQANKILNNVGSVSVSDTHTLAVDVYGNLYGFGDNSYSEMGNRTTASSSLPIKLMNGVKQAQAGRYFSVVLTKNGEVHTAGRNDLGQLGTGDARDYAVFKKVLDGVMKIAVGENSCAALTERGELYVWGDNSQGQFGLEEAQINAPTKIADDVYDVALGKGSMGIIRLNRNVEFSGVARGETAETFDKVYTFDATVPEEEMYQEIVEMPSLA